MAANYSIFYLTISSYFSPISILALATCSFSLYSLTCVCKRSGFSMADELSRGKLFRHCSNLVAKVLRLFSQVGKWDWISGRCSYCMVRVASRIVSFLVFCMRLCSSQFYPLSPFTCKYLSNNSPSACAFY